MGQDQIVVKLLKTIVKAMYAVSNEMTLSGRDELVKPFFLGSVKDTNKPLTTI
jgi:hypothetical protein